MTERDPVLHSFKIERRLQDGQWRAQLTVELEIPDHDASDILDAPSEETCVRICSSVRRLFGS